MWKIWLIALSLWLLPMSADAEVLTPQEAQTRLSSGEIMIIDVRLPMEWAKTGLPEGALGISLQDQTLGLRQGFVEDVLQALDGDRDRPVALICASGQRSAFAQKLLADNGFTAVHDIGEGVTGGERGPGWLQRRLPTEPCAVC